MKQSKVTSIQSAGLKNGWHNYEIALEDGAVASKGFKSVPEHIKVGTTVEYELRDDYPQFYKSINPVGYNGVPQTQFKADPMKQNSIEAQVALKSAIEFHAAFGFQDPSLGNHIEVSHTANFFYEWIKTK